MVCKGDDDEGDDEGDNEVGMFFLNHLSSRSASLPATMVGLDSKRGTHREAVMMTIEINRTLS